MSEVLSTFLFTAFFLDIIGYTSAVVAQYYGAGKSEHCIDKTTLRIYLSVFSTGGGEQSGRARITSKFRIVPVYG